MKTMLMFAREEIQKNEKHTTFLFFLFRKEYILARIRLRGRETYVGLQTRCELAQSRTGPYEARRPWARLEDKTWGKLRLCSAKG